MYEKEYQNSFQYVILHTRCSIVQHFLFFLCVVSDFTSIVDFSVTFAPDESEKRVTIQTSADSVLEGTEQFSAVLSSPPDRVTITQDTADVSILDTGSGKHV